MGDGQIFEDRSDGEGLCPACESPITKFDPQRPSKPVNDEQKRKLNKLDSSTQQKLKEVEAFFEKLHEERPLIIFCPLCYAKIQSSLLFLQSFDGFATDLI
jgi:hypothetical protein